jgi:hypothetical protein
LTMSAVSPILLVKARDTPKPSTGGSMKKPDLTKAQVNALNARTPIQRYENALSNLHTLRAMRPAVPKVLIDSATEHVARASARLSRADVDVVATLHQRRVFGFK